MPSPQDELWRLFASPVPTHTTLGSVGLMATSPIDTVVWESKTFSHVLPPLIVFNRPPDADADIEDRRVVLVDGKVGDAPAHEHGTDVAAGDAVKDRVRHLGQDGGCRKQQGDQECSARSQHSDLDRHYSTTGDRSCTPMSRRGSPGALLAEVFDLPGKHVPVVLVERRREDVRAVVLADEIQEVDVCRFRRRLQ